MFSYIDTLRKKPIEERRQIAKSITIVAVVVIGFLWFVFNFFHLNSLFVDDTAPSQQQKESGEERITAPYE